MLDCRLGVLATTEGWLGSPAGGAVAKLFPIGPALGTLGMNAGGADEPNDAIGGSYDCCWGGPADGDSAMGAANEAPPPPSLGAKSAILGGGRNCSASSATPSVLTHFFLSESQTI